MAKTKSATDNKTLDLIREVNRQKAEISKAEKPNWLTNCSFNYSEPGTDRPISRSFDGSCPSNIHVESSISRLVDIAGFLLSQEESYKKAIEALGIEAPSYTWNSFSVKDWLEDIKNRINKIQIASKKKKLEALEERLGKIVSPELRAKMELEAIQDELGI